MVDQVEKVARAIADCEWDQACSALGTPIFPRGGNWTAKLPQARAAIAAFASTDDLTAEIEAVLVRFGYPKPPHRALIEIAALSAYNPNERLREALPIFERVTRLADTLASDVPITAAAREHINRAYAELAALSHKEEGDGPDTARR